MQNYYHPGKFGKSHIRNCHYRVFFYNRIEQQQMKKMSLQIADSPKFFAANFQFLRKTFPSDPSFYILIDGHSRSQIDDFWCRSKIFPDKIGGEIQPIFFFPNITSKK